MTLHATLVVRERELARHTVRLVNCHLWRYLFMTPNSQDAETNGPGHTRASVKNNSDGFKIPRPSEAQEEQFECFKRNLYSS